MTPWNRAEPYEPPYLEDSSDFPLVQTMSIQTTTTGVRLASRWKNLRWFILKFAVTFTWVVLLVSYAYLSSFSSIPFKIFQTPARAILAINLGSTVATILLAALIDEGSEILRWRLATRHRKGIAIATFLALGRATTLLGVIRLLFSGENVGQKRWCILRFHMKK
jgi:hypothetical protein